MSLVDSPLEMERTALSGTISPSVVREPNSEAPGGRATGGLMLDLTARASSGQTDQHTGHVFPYEPLSSTSHHAQHSLQQPSPYLPSLPPLPLLPRDDVFAAPQPFSPLHQPLGAHQPTLNSSASTPSTSMALYTDPGPLPLPLPPQPIEEMSGSSLSSQLEMTTQSSPALRPSPISPVISRPLVNKKRSISAAGRRGSAAVVGRRTSAPQPAYRFPSTSSTSSIYRESLAEEEPSKKRRLEDGGSERPSTGQGSRDAPEPRRSDSTSTVVPSIVDQEAESGISRSQDSSLPPPSARASDSSTGRGECPPRSAGSISSATFSQPSNVHPVNAPYALLDFPPIEERVAILERQRVELLSALAASQDGTRELRRQLEGEVVKGKALSNLLAEVYLVVQRLDPAGLPYRFPFHVFNPAIPGPFPTSPDRSPELHRQSQSGIFTTAPPLSSWEGVSPM